MPAMEPLCHLMGVDSRKLSREENLILEAELFARVCEELKETYKIQHKDYLKYCKSDAEMENVMIESSFIRKVINDILSTKTYTLAGIACYTQIPEEVIYEVARGVNDNPTLALPRRVIELHRSVRADLYKEILRKNGWMNQSEGKQD